MFFTSLVMVAGQWSEVTFTQGGAPGLRAYGSSIVGRSLDGAPNELWLLAGQANALSNTSVERDCWISQSTTGTGAFTSFIETKAQGGLQWSGRTVRSACASETSRVLFRASTTTR